MKKNTVTITTEVQNINDTSVNAKTRFVVRRADEVANIAVAEFSTSEFMVLRDMFTTQDTFYNPTIEAMGDRGQFNAWAGAIEQFIITKITQCGEGQTPKQTAIDLYVELNAKFIGDALANLLQQYTIVAGEITQDCL